jgi:hypothetical protein
MDVRQCASSRLAALFIMLFIAAPSGCARLSSIHRSESVPSDKGHILSIDAKQRNVLSAPHPLNANARIIRFCSEPPPDVFTAIASTLGLKAAMGTEQARQDISAELQQTISENAATIERTQTVNILREAMFRNCERYLSGAISDQEFIVQAARDQRAMVHVLAIEQLSGASKAQATALTTLAKAASSGVTADSIQSLDKAQGNVQKTRAAADKARTDATAATPTGACVAGDDAYKDSGATADQITAKKTACAAANKADGDAKQAADHYATVKDAVERQSQLSSEASGSISSVTLSAQAASQTTANAITQIVALNDDFNEMEMTCVVLFRNLDKYASTPGVAARMTNGNDAYLNKCLELLSAVIEKEKAAAAREQAQLLLEKARAEQETQAIESRAKDIIEAAAPDAQKVWNAVGGASGVTLDALSALEKKAGVTIPAGPKAKLLQSRSVADFSRTFAGLNTKMRTALAKAATP